MWMVTRELQPPMALIELNSVARNLVTNLLWFNHYFKNFVKSLVHFRTFDYSLLVVMIKRAEPNLANLEMLKLLFTIGSEKSIIISSQMTFLYFLNYWTAHHYHRKGQKIKPVLSFVAMFVGEIWAALGSQLSSLMDCLAS